MEVGGPPVGTFGTPVVGGEPLEGVTGANVVDPGTWVVEVVAVEMVVEVAATGGTEVVDSPGTSGMAPAGPAPYAQPTTVARAMATGKRKDRRRTGTGFGGFGGRAQIPASASTRHRVDAGECTSEPVVKTGRCPSACSDHGCSPHSSLSRPVHRPERGWEPSETGDVHGLHPMDG